MKKKDKNAIEINGKTLRNSIIVAIFCIVIIICLGAYVLLKLNPYLIVDYEGYAVPGSDITEYLLSGVQTTNENRNVKALKIKEQSTIYKNIHSYYVVEDEKINVNINYPIYINENITLYNVSNDIKLITNYYEELDGYANSSLVSGVLYNMKDLERADYHNYIFIKNSDWIYINTYEMNIKTDTKEYKIPMNSIVYFNEDYISYYTMEGELFIYNCIPDVDITSDIKIGELQELKYEQLLQKLNIIEVSKNEQQEEIIYKQEPEQKPIIGDIKIELPEIKEEEEKKEEEKPKEEPKEEENTEDKVEEPEYVYIKPEVSCTEFTTNVYTTRTLLKIFDPGGNIKSPISFTIKRKGDVYLRKAFLSSGNFVIGGLLPNEKYSIIGEYTYKSEDGETIKKTIIEQDIQTLPIDTLNTIELGFEYGDILGDGINLKNLKIVSDLRDEALYGIKKVSLIINDSTYSISSEKINKMLSGQMVDYKISNALKSNSEYNFEIKFYDIAGNELKVANNTGTIRTAKKAPAVKIKVETKNITTVTAKLDIQNPDNVEIGGFRYVVFQQDGTVVGEGNLGANQEELQFKNLDPNFVYTIKVYGGYDLEDAVGTQEDIELGSTTFTTVPITALGHVYLKNDITSLEKNKFAMNLSLITNKTDSRLIAITKSLNIKLYDFETNELVETKCLTDDLLNNFKNNIETIVEFNNLKSSTKYRIEIDATTLQGSTETIIKATYNLENLITMKEPAQVLIRNKFVTGTMIDFDVKIQDVDNSILSNNVHFEVRDESNKLIQVEKIKVNDDYLRLDYDKLTQNKTYYMYFYADSYNEGSDNSTYQSNYLLSKQSFYTEMGISGSIELQDLTRITSGKNLIDVASRTKWYSACWNTSKYYGNDYYFDRNEDENILRLYAGKSSTNQYYSYDFSSYIGQTVTISFDAKVDENSTGMNAYLQATKTNSNSKLLTKITDLSATEWKKFRYTITIDNTGYAGFYVVANSAAKNQYLYLKNVQVELGKSASSYKPYEYELESNFIINLNDARNEITTNDYYLRIYENGRQNKQDRFIEIDDTNSVKDALKTYNLNNDTSYKIELLAKIKERFYVLNSTEFNTEVGEIFGIGSIQDWLKIQPNGNYVVYSDLDFTGVGNGYKFGGSNMAFNGTIDFGGYTVTRNQSPANFIYQTSSGAVLKNIVLDVKINSSSAVSYFYPLVYSNRGTISNAMFNLVECTPNSNNYVTLCSYSNGGIIENFIVNYKVPLYCSRVVGGLSLYGGGTYRNGYIIGEDIQAIFNMSNSQYRCTGALIYDLERNGLLQNVYSLVNVTCSTSNDYTWYNITGNLVEYLNRSQVKNVYSIGHGENYHSLSNGPNIGRITNAKVQNSYYFESDVIFNNSFNTKGNSLALWDKSFQEQFLNSDKKFDVSLVDSGYFPHLNLPDVMPNQEFMDLPTVDDKDLPDMLSMEIEKEIPENNEVIVSMVLNNPDATDIVEVVVGDLSSEIIEQYYEEGKSTVRVRLYDPKTYVSQYSLMSITVKGATNKNYTKNFEKGERTVYVDFYKPIYNVSEWKEIKTIPTQNYRLMADLDFANEGDSIAISATYTGKIDGNNHKIKNIKLSENYTNSLITTLNGTLKNLYIENFVYKPLKATRVGIIKQANEKAIIDNVHVKGIELSSSYGAENVYIGGIVAAASSSIITNSSVTDFKLKIDSALNGLRLGGIVGDGTVLRMSNCYTQNFNFEVNNVIVVEGIGGILGKENDTGGTLRYCYAQGKIVSDGMNIGGICGCANSIVRNNYSLVNIESEDENVGGICGQDLDGSTSNVAYNLFLGNIYNKKEGSKYVHRIIGSNTTELYNYAYENQLINGKKSPDIDGSTLLSAEEIFDQEIYTDLGVLGFEDNFEYSGLKDNILPKLLNDTTGEILPNQKDLKIIQPEIHVEDIEFSKGANINIVEVAVTINNPSEVEITDVLVENMNVSIQSNSTLNGKTYINFTGTAEKYYDNYKVYAVKYKFNQEELIADLDGMIEARLYKEITSFADWQSIDQYSAENYRLTIDLDFTGRTDINTNVSIGRLEVEGENKTISGLNLNFSGNCQSLIKEITKSIKNVNFKDITIKNTSTASYLGVIGKVSGDMNNINFDNITITGTNINRVGLIYRCSAFGIDTMNLNNINVTGKGYVGGISGMADSGIYTKITGTTINVTGTGDYVGGFFGCVNRRNLNDLKNMTITGATVTTRGSRASIMIGQGRGSNLTAIDSSVNGASYVAGLVGYVQYNCGNNNKVEHCNITGTGNYVGGLYGYASTNASTTCSTHNISRSEIKGNGNYVGGIIGQMSSYILLRYSYVDNCKIEGNNHVGGVAGQFVASSNSSQYMYVTNSEISGRTNYIGGIVGYCSMTLNYSYVTDCTVTGKGASSSYVGGIVGFGRSAYSNVKNTDVISNGNHVGGICGYIDGGNIAAYSVFEGMGTIKGTNNVGGIAGTLKYGNVYYSHSNAEIIATNSGAGGIVGYLDNTNNEIKTISGVGVLNQGTYIYTCAVMGSTITASSQAGGIIGKSYKALLDIGTDYKPKSYYYSNYVEAYINTTAANGGILSLGIGNNMAENKKLTNTYVYKNSTLNGQTVNTTNDSFEENQYLELKDLKVQSTYTSKLKWTSDKKVIDSTAAVISVTYPTQTYLDKKYYTPISLPLENAVGTLSMLGIDSLKLLSLAPGAKEIILPDVKVYPVGINEINLEFSDKDDYSYFKIVYNDKEQEPQYVKDSRVFTYKYDFKNPFDIVISNDTDTNIVSIDPSYLCNKITINDGQYYYIKAQELYEAENCIGADYLHLYNNKVLKADGNISDIDNLENQEKIDFEGLVLTDKKSFAEYQYENYLIKNYTDFSEVVTDEKTQEKTQRLFVKNNKLYCLDGNLDMVYNGVILDYYNEQEYQTILGNDGKLYDLKTKLKYPENFENQDIESITNNLDDTTGLIMVLYKSDRVVVFNYISGELVFDNEAQADVSFKEFLTDKLKTEELLLSPDIDEYNNSLKLQEKLIDTPITEYNQVYGIENTGEANTEFVNIDIPIVENTSNSENTLSTPTNSTNYVTMYDAISNNYVVYQESELLTQEEPKTENTKIQQSAEKTNYYITQVADSKHSNEYKGNVIVYIIIGCIVIGLFIINKRRNK